jgi:glycosyltransferase involved in cell wall biosynthesis
MQVFQVLPSVVRRIDGQLQIDVDFYEALEVYLQHFESVCIACPISTSSEYGTGLERCRAIDHLDPNRFRIIELPNAYSLGDFVRNFNPVRRILRSEIEDAEFLIVSPHTLIGDWPTVAAREAERLGKPYVVEADVVYESLARNAIADEPIWKKSLKEALIIAQMQRSYRRSLHHSKLALFQGKDVYDAYSSFCANPQQVQHHIPIYERDHISEEGLRAKLNRVRENRPLNICYAGRAIDMKGPLDWIDVLQQLSSWNVRLNAVWAGDGPLLPVISSKASGLMLSGQVKFPGYVSDRDRILDTIRSSDIFLFCHKTRESARVLGEALACACPLVGYAGAYPADLVREHGGGLFADLGDRKQLARHIQRLDRDRDELCDLIERAARSGRSFDRTRLLHERMQMVRRYVGPSASSSAV